MLAFDSAPAPSRPRTPVPKFRYLNDPARYGSAYAHRQTPFEGDFCVMSIDHVASVAHLGQKAMEVAKRIPSERYVAYTGMSIACRPSNLFTIAPVCQGIPPQSTYSDDTPACIPILPNKDCYGGRQPLEAAAPFPWPDCYISTFTAQSCRVTTAKRDYSQVLSVLPDLVNARASRMTLQDKEVFYQLRKRRDQGDLEALARIPPPEFSSAESSADPLSFLPPTSTDSSQPVQSDADCTTNVDGTHATHASSDKFPSYDPANFPLEMAMCGLPASIWFQPLDTDTPVVNIWYDLAMVSGVRDPRHFVSECEMLEKVKAYFHRDIFGERRISSPSARSITYPRPTLSFIVPRMRNRSVKSMRKSMKSRQLSQSSEEPRRIAPLPSPGRFP
ncbi:hypothetical protein PENSPDRAFT_760217 [Peniophora sp. CONT]|nr:hypothetical protein PENSPDRAFT_760217 [Peniophora sp. CONT]